jgi:hypothetical protein
MDCATFGRGREDYLLGKYFDQGLGREALGKESYGGVPRVSDPKANSVASLP